MQVKTIRRFLMISTPQFRRTKFNAYDRHDEFDTPFYKVIIIFSLTVCPPTFSIAVREQEEEVSYLPRAETPRLPDTSRRIPGF